MKNRLAGLGDLVGKPILIRVNRKPIDDHLIDGFVVGVSKHLLLLHIVDGSTLVLNAYIAVRLSDIRSFRIDKSFIGHALQMMERSPVSLEGIDLTNWASLLDFVSAKYSLFMLYMDKKRPGCGYVGREVSRTAKYVELNEVDTKGKWSKTRRYAFKDITQIDFDDGYLNGLALMIEHSPTC